MSGPSRLDQNWQHLGDVFRRLAMQKECRVEAGHTMPDHVHMMIPPKYAVLQVMGYIEGKSAIHLARGWREEAQLRRAALLGSGILRLDRGRGDQGINR